MEIDEVCRISEVVFTYYSSACVCCYLSLYTFVLMYLAVLQAVCGSCCVIIMLECLLV